ncbi:MAG: hypothetical protein AVDCRST_MAG04-62, partial [uncultured Acetobacteraceae bacterium]
ARPTPNREAPPHPPTPPAPRRAATPPCRSLHIGVRHGPSGAGRIQQTV